MSRKILLVDSSKMMRRIIRGMILANVNDAEVIEAEDAWAAKDMVTQEKFHIILYSWEISDKNGLNLLMKQDKHPPIVILTSKNQEKHIKTNLKNDTEYIIVPCSSEELAIKIKRLCNLKALRSNKRYSPLDSSVILQQRNEQLPGSLINISSGGLLCEFDFSEPFNWSQPVNIQIRINLDNETINISDLYSRMVRLRVCKTHPDFTPKKIRAAFVFITMPNEENKKLLEKVFLWAENREQMLEL